MRVKTTPDALGVPLGAASTPETRLAGWRLLVARAVAYTVVTVTVILGIVLLISATTTTGARLEDSQP